MDADESNQKMDQLIAKTWSDAEFKQRLLDDPRGVLEAAGAQIPAGLQVRALANTDRVFHLVLPMKPTHLSDLDLDNIAAGAGGRFAFPFIWFSFEAAALPG